MGNVLDEADWQRLMPLVRAECPRLTPGDLADCHRRIDLLTAKIQNRHWVDRVTARRLVLTLLERLTTEPSSS